MSHRGPRPSRARGTLWRGSASISAKLMRMNLMVAGVVLLLAVVAFFLYDLISFQRNLVRNLNSAARIVGANSVSALLFDDPLSATTTLDALRSSPDIVAAALVGDDGAVFAQYRRTGNTESLRMPPLPVGVQDKSWLSGTKVLLAHRIIFEGKPAGTVYILAELTETTRRARHYLLMAFLILLVCMVAAFLISATARRLIAQPIIALAETARRVSRERDYSVRAGPHPDKDEIAVLIEAFNEMLVQIEQREAALNRARDLLEVRVQERTEELRAANRELEAFSYTVAHDLRGPLDAIQGMVFILQTLDREGSNGDRGEILEQLRRGTSNMGLLIDDLLNLSRASTHPLRATPVHLSVMAHEIAKELQRAEPQRKVQFMIASVPQIEADQGLMRVALDNLIRNSWKYTARHDKACIEFGMKISDGETVFFVRDDGAGFDQALADQLFQPFHRLHSRSEFPGTGIGLATVQRILARHGGRIWAEGAPEKGATFWFTTGPGVTTQAPPTGV